MEHRSLRFQQISSTAILLLAALIWGMCFVAQRSGMDYLGPFIFNSIRALMASLTLGLILLVVVLLSRRTGNQQQQGTIPDTSTLPRAASSVFRNHKQILLGGSVTGICFFLASNTQQIGLVSVTASKAAFITTLYVVLVPLLGLVLKHKTHWNTWLGASIAVAGLYLLCMSESLSLGRGDTILIVSALFWATHILAVGHFAPRLSFTQLFAMCTIQFAVTGVLSFGCALGFDHLFVAVPLSVDAIRQVGPELLYAGILSTAGGFSLQALAQKYAPPSPAAIVMSCESVFGLIGGVLILGEVLTSREGFGCLLMFVAVLLAQLEFKPRSHRSHPE